MFNIFGQSKDSPTDVKGVRDALLRAIKENLQKAEGGEGRNIKGIIVFINIVASDKHMYEAAVYQEDPDRFKEEVQKIADDFDIGLPDSWAMEILLMIFRRKRSG
jgi:hypothetical protein